MEKHIQAWWFGWASLIFPHQQKWNNTLGKWSDNTAVHFADDRLCVPSGHHHLSHSPIPVEWIFFLSCRVILTPTNFISSDISPNPQELGHSLEKLKKRPGLFSKSKSLSFHSRLLQLHALSLSSPCTLNLCSRLHYIFWDEFTDVSNYPCKGFWKFL